MTGRFAEAISKAASVSPMACVSQHIIPNRVLRADGDGLAYYCAGKDGSNPADAKAAVLDKLRSAAAAVGASKIEVLLTASGSTKGGRYAVATVKPYQGQRANSRRPENWRYLRDFLETHDRTLFVPVVSQDQEADDLFAQASTTYPYEECVIYTQDKDMRQMPGVHLDWVNHSIVVVPPGTWEIVVNDKVYGYKWFWLQMLHGDTADYIPGLPGWRTVDSKGKPAVKLCGEVTAAKLLSNANSNRDGFDKVLNLYVDYYESPELGWMHLCEQAILLWMQRTNDPFDVFALGAPLEGTRCAPYVIERIIKAKELNELARQTQDHAG